jgi:hypothetical protein
MRVDVALEGRDDDKSTRTTRFVVPSDITFAQLAREAARWYFGHDGESKAVALFTPDGSVCAEGVLAGLQPETLEEGLVLRRVAKERAQPTE